MTREWKAGDVAVIEVYGAERVAMRQLQSWTYAEGQGSTETYDRSGYVTPVRPLLVLDPEDRDQVEHLVCLLADNGWTPSRRDGARAALRAMLEPPAPPRPDEPTDIGSWVTDGEGSRWVLMPPAYGARRWCRWSMSPPGTDSSNRSWTDLALPVTVGEAGEAGEAEPAFPPDLIDSADWVWRWSDAKQGYCINLAAPASTREQVDRDYGPVREVPRSAAVTA